LRAPSRASILREMDDDISETLLRIERLLGEDDGEEADEG
jgi:hypothetical protein